MTYLFPPLLQMVDENKLVLRPAVELSHLAQEEQALLLEVMGRLGVVPTLEQALRLPVFCNTGCRHDTIERILKVADGACVGTALKGADGRVDLEKVRTFMELARR